MNTLTPIVAAAAIACATVLSTSGCAQRLAADASSLARQREQLYKFEDREVTLVGDARAVDSEEYRGSAVLLDDQTAVRVPEIKSWPKSARGEEVTIRGVLRRYTPTGTRGASVDEWFTLEAVRWQKGDLSPRR